MKLWGQLSEISKILFRKDTREITLRPNNTTTYSGPVNVDLPPQTTDAVLVSADSQQTLTNKTFDADGTGNVLSNVDDGNIKAGADITRSKLAAGSNDHVVINSATGVMSSEQYLHKTRGGTGITSTATFPASGTVAVTGDKLSAFAATTSAELAGVISDETGSGALVFGTSPSLTTPAISLATLSSYSTTTAAANSTITPASDLPVIVITSVTSANINAVANPANGKQIFLVNNSSSDLIINNDSGSPSTSGIVTGTGGTFTLKDGASVSLLYNTSMNRWTLSGGAGGSGAGTVINVLGGASGYPVGTPVYLSGSTVLPASAAAANTAEVIGLVSAEPTSGTYDVLLLGAIEIVSTSAYDTGVASPAGTVLFLSPTAGKLTAVEPSVIGQVSLPLAVSQAGTGIVVAPKRGAVIGGANARTQLTLLNVTTPQDVQDVSAYSAGELTGWVQISATSSKRFYLAAQFTQNMAANDYTVSYQTSGDTPPTGFNVTVTTTGMIQVTLASSSVAGFVSASINYALNAPAVGATFPLSIDASTITTGTVSASRLPSINTATLTNTGITGVTGASATAAFAAGSGKIGETITATGSSQTLTSGQYNDGGVAVQTLQPGVWAIYAGGYFNPSSSSTVVGRNIVGIGTASGNNSSGMVIPYETTSCPGSSGGTPNMITAPPAIKVLTVASNFYVKLASEFTVAGQTGTGYFKAVRIA